MVYSWQGLAQANWDLYVQATYGEERLQLTDDPARDTHPVWGPDGGHIAFVRTDGEGACAILLISAVGGATTELALCGAGGVLSLDWSGNGHTLAFAARDSEHAPGRLFLLDMATRSVRALETPGPPTAGIDDVGFSPDGELLAYTLVSALGVEDLHVRRLDTTETRRVTFDNMKIHGFDWLPDGSGFVLSSNRGGEFALWRITLDGESALVRGAVGGADEPALSDGGRLIRGLASGCGAVALQAGSAGAHSRASALFDPLRVGRTRFARRAAARVHLRPFRRRRGLGGQLGWIWFEATHRLWWALHPHTPLVARRP